VHAAEGATAAATKPAASASATPVTPVDISAVAEHPMPSGLPAGWQHGAFMEILVRGYQDSDGDGIGDLKGLTQRLDYLHDLGVRGLWLMPITLSGDHDHGYAVADFRRIEPAYGTMADFDELVRQAHRRGIAIVIDYVINHSSKQNPLFLSSAASKSSPYRDWYVWEDTKPTGWDIFGHDPWTMTPNGAYFGQFGDDMPDFNLRNPRVVQYHIDSLRMWLNHGTDGFRIDAVGHLFENGPKGWSLQPENYTFLHALRAKFKAYGDRYWVCEAPGDPQGFGKESACGASFAFGQSGALVQAAQGDAKAIRAVADYWLTAPEGMATMVSNHDAFAGPRLWDALHGDVARVKLAAATYLLQPGTPYLYYGEELGMSGTPAEDRDWKLRGPVSWTGDPRTAGFTTGTPYRAPSINVATNNAEREAHDPNSMLAFYRAMIGLRNAHPSIALGHYVSPRVDGNVLSFQRTWKDERTVVVLNYGTDASTAMIEGLPPKARLQALYPVASATGASSASGAAALPELRANAAGVAHVAADALSVHVYTIR
jgi:glycosidase